MKVVNLFALLFAAFALTACFGKKDQAPAEAPVAAEAPAADAPAADAPAADAPAADAPAADAPAAPAA